MIANNSGGRILLIGSHHGHELLGDYLWGHIETSRPELLRYLDFVIANPDAKSRGVRLIESDMNRSYNGKNSTHEEKLASALLRKIQRENYSFALDLHTTTTVVEPSIITANFKYTWKFIRSSHIQKIIKMPQKIAWESFIGNFPRSVSIEINENDARRPEILDRICDDIERFIHGAALDKKRDFFVVKSYLRRSEKLPPGSGLLPFLVGEESYRSSPYIGFVAQQIDSPYSKNSASRN